MTIATPEQYQHMLNTAREQGYAYPAINVTSTQTLNAALQGFAEAESDGIIQVSVGGAAYFSGQAVNNRVAGSLAFAAFAREIAAQYPNITIALHTDHCAQQYLDDWVRPLLAHEVEQVKRGEEPAFQSHMWDGSTLALQENLSTAKELLAISREAHTLLEIEIGAVGGEEDGHSAAIDEKLYSTPDEAMHVVQALGLPSAENAYTTAFTFGNVHGAYKPGMVKLRPQILQDIQRAVSVRYGARAGQALSDGRQVSAGGRQASERVQLPEDSGQARKDNGQLPSGDAKLAKSSGSLSEGNAQLPENMKLSGNMKLQEGGAQLPGGAAQSPMNDARISQDSEQMQALRLGKPFLLVFHGGSGSTPEEIAQAVSYGVVKMNIDTDTQYAFTRAIAGHMFAHYDGVLKIDGEVGEKRYYDPRSWGRESESAMAKRVVEACVQLGSAGKAMRL